MQSLSVEENVIMLGVLLACEEVKRVLEVDITMQFEFIDDREEFEGCQLSSSGCMEMTGSGENELEAEDDEEEDNKEEPLPPVKRV